MKYNITCTYTENAKHSRIEKYERTSAAEAKAFLTEYLDLFAVGGKAEKPTKKKTAEALGKYSSPDFVKDEFERQSNAYKVFRKFEKLIDGGMAGSLSCAYGDNETIAVEPS